MIRNLPFTLQDLADGYAAGLTPQNVVEEVYRRIAEVDDPAIFIHLRDMASVIEDARRLGPRRTETPLWGIPYVVKDNIDVAGLPTTAACPAYGYVASEDAEVVAKLRAAGALLIGKTNLDQFATGLVGVRSPYGVPRNSVDPEIVPGGSSSGSAVSVGHGFVTFSLGTDTAGSGRVPAALNNIVGLKPSLGTLSATGVVPACRTLDTVSIFAMTVADALAIYSATAGYDPRDAYSRRMPIHPAAPLPQTTRIGVPDAASIRFFGDALQAEMFDAALDHLRAAGAEIVPFDFQPLYDVAEMLYDGAWVAERYTVIETLMRDQPEALHPVTRKIIGAAETLSAADAFRGMYRLRELSRTAEAPMSGLDALCVPTIPTFYSLGDLEADPVTPNSNFGTYTNFVNLMDMCGIAVPTAPRADGRPGSVTILAPAGKDTACAAIAQVFERGIERRMGATAYRLLAPAAPATSVGPDDVELVVCGAHMSGLALNTELTSRGGRLLRQTTTAPNYRLYALAGGPPQRPGLLKIEKGAAIEVECWALPASAFGEFLRGVPAPLCIGTIELADGTRAHGFLVEAAGVQGAEDITRLGGWRGFLARRTQHPEPAE